MRNNIGNVNKFSLPPEWRTDNKISIIRFWKHCQLFYFKTYMNAWARRWIFRKMGSRLKILRRIRVQDFSKKINHMLLRHTFPFSRRTIAQYKQYKDKSQYDFPLIKNMASLFPNLISFHGDINNRVLPYFRRIQRCNSLIINIDLCRNEGNPFPKFSYVLSKFNRLENITINNVDDFSFTNFELFEILERITSQEKVKITISIRDVKDIEKENKLKDCKNNSAIRGFQGKFSSQKTYRVFEPFLRHSTIFLDISFRGITESSKLFSSCFTFEEFSKLKFVSLAQDMMMYNEKDLNSFFEKLLFPKDIEQVTLVFSGLNFSTSSLDLESPISKFFKRVLTYHKLHALRYNFQISSGSKFIDNILNCFPIEGNQLEELHLELMGSEAELILTESSKVFNHLSRFCHLKKCSLNGMQFSHSRLIDCNHSLPELNNLTYFNFHDNGSDQEVTFQKAFLGVLFRKILAKSLSSLIYFEYRTFSNEFDLESLSELISAILLMKNLEVIKLHINTSKVESEQIESLKDVIFANRKIIEADLNFTHHIGKCLN